MRRTLAILLFLPSVALAAGEPPLVFSRHFVDPTGDGQVTESLGVGDLDGDGLPDVVVGGDERLVWFRAPVWEPHPIARGQFGAGAMTVVRDLDGDGRLDIAIGRINLSGRRETDWFQNRPDLPGGWKREVLTREAYCHDLVFGDLDGDGRPDAVCVDQQLGRLLWLGAPSDPRLRWSVHAIDPGVDAMGAAIADLDGDGRPDVVAGRAWYRQNEDGSWTRRDYTTVARDGLEAFDDYAKLAVLDLDGDGRLDIVACLYAETPMGTMMAFLAPPDPLHEPWTAVTIDPGPLFGVHSLAVASFDGTPRPQIMVGETNIGGFDFGFPPDPHVYVYRLLGDATDASAWERSVVDTVGTHEAQAADLDGDGRVDIAGHDENTNLVGTDGPVRWWKNETGAP